MAESKVKCSGVKTAQNSQREGGDERKTHENVKLKEEDVPGVILPREEPEESTMAAHEPHLGIKQSGNGCF